MIYRVLIFACLLFGLASGVRSQHTSNSSQHQSALTGTEFIVCFPYTDVPAYDESQSIYLSSYDDTAIVIITCKAYPSYEKVFTLTPHAYLRYVISSDLDPGIKSSEELSDNAIVVVSTSPVTCYFQTTNEYSDQDGTLALPRESAGKEYFVISYKNYRLPGPPPKLTLSGEFVVGAFEDGTEVTISVTAPTKNSQDTIPNLHFSLSRGQCIQIRCSEDSAQYDISGSAIVSNKPITVYAGHRSTNVPSNYLRALDEGSLLEALPPTNLWGKTFLCKILAPREKFVDTLDIASKDVYEVVRILASVDNTIVRVNDTIVTSLKAGGFYEIEVRDRLFIQTSSPTLVAEFGHSSYSEGADTAGGPFMAILPPLEQRFNEYTFFNQLDSGLTTWAVHYLVISGDTSIRNRIILDDKPLLDTGFVNLPYSVNGEQFTIGSYLIDSGVHHISTTNPPEKGMTLLTYGYGWGYGYGYGIGALNNPSSGVRADECCRPSSESIKGLTSSQNPFLKETTLEFTLNRMAYVQVSVLDELGKLVWGDGRGSTLEAGTHQIHIDASTLPSGIYYARISTGFGEVKTIKLIHEK